MKISSFVQPLKERDMKAALTIKKHQDQGGMKNFKDRI
jgi:hypothetical protein